MPLPTTTFTLSLLLLGMLAPAGNAQSPGLRNGDFEGDHPGQPPTAWLQPDACTKAGNTLEVTDAAAAGGKHCAALRGPVGAGVFANCMQMIDATPFRGKRVRFAASVRCEPAAADSRAQLWLRVDRPDGQMGAFDNMDDRPIRSSRWQRYELVGDVAEDADAIALGMMLIGGGMAMLDDAVLQVVGDDVPTTGRPPRPVGAPGLAVVTHAATAHVRRDIDRTRLRFPLPLAYRDQTPLTFRLQIEPETVAAHAAISVGPGPNRVLELELRDVDIRTDLTVRYESVVLVTPSSFDGAPTHAAFPAHWPDEATPWLAASWCCDAADPRLQAIGTDLRDVNGDIMAVIDATLRRSQQIFAAADGRVQTLTAVEALDHRGSCTSCANLVAALLRAAGVPARVLSGYPLWSGPLQTHYIVEAYVADYGWYPIESTLGRAPWPNHQQINVSVVPIEHESQALAGPRSCAAGAVPYLSLTELEGDTITLEGTLAEYCDHAARLLRPLDAKADEWQDAQAWARSRWAQWLATGPEIRRGRIEFGPASEAVAGTTLAALRRELP